MSHGEAIERTATLSHKLPAHGSGPEDQSGDGGEADRDIGRRIRHLRKARDLSLKDVAERSGLSVSFLSQIERGTSSPSVRVLVRIASALNVALSSLFNGSDHSHVPEPSLVQRREDRRRLSFRETSISKELVTPPAQASGLDIYLITIEPGGSTGGEAYSHGGEEAGLVLRGTLELQVDGQVHVLRTGDGFGFESRRPHRFKNPGATLTQVVWVNARIPQA